MAGPLDGYTPSAGGPLAGYTPGAPKPSPSNNSNSWASWLTSPTFANESLLNEAKDVGLSGADYATLGAVKKLAPTSWGVEQAHNNLGLADYGLGAAAYALGPGKILAPLAASAKLGALGSAALEGAMAGGASGAIANPTDPWGVATGAAAGGALGGAAGGLGKVASTVAGRFAPAVDPAAAVASTKAARDAAYAPLKDIHFDPNDVMAAHSSTTLTPGMAADVSPWMEQTIAKQQQFIQDGGASANDVADYAKNLRKMANAPGASNGDQILGNQIADSLTGNPDRQIPGLLGGAQPTSNHPVGLAARQLDVANAAHQNYAMGWIPTRSATPSTALVPQRKVGFPIPNAGLLLAFQGTKTARREGISSPFSDAGGCTSPRNSGWRRICSSGSSSSTTPRSALAPNRGNRLSIIRRAVSSTKRWWIFTRLAPIAAAVSPIRWRTLPARGWRWRAPRLGRAGPWLPAWARPGTWRRFRSRA
jgi:hypothetical protein